MSSQSSPIAPLSGVLLSLACLIYFIQAPVNGFGLPMSWHDEQRAMQLPLLFVACVACVLLVPKTNPSFKQMATALLLAIVVLGVLSASLSPTPLDGLGEVGLHVALLGLALAMFALVAQRPEAWCRRICVAAVFVGASYLTGVTTKYWASIMDGRAIDVHVVMLGYLNPRFPSALHALLLPLIAAAALDGKIPRAIRVCAFVVGAGLWATNLGLATRGIWVVFALVCAVAFVVPRWGLRKLALLQTASALAGVLLYLLAVNVPNSTGVPTQLQSRSVDLTSLSFRDELWTRSFHLMQVDPLLGAGPMRFATDPHLVSAHPHNWILQFASEWGIPAAILAVIVAGVVCRKTLAPTGMANSPVERAPTFSMLVFLAYSFIDGIHVMPVSQTLGFLVIGTALGVASSKEVSTNTTASRWPYHVATGTALVSAIWVNYYGVATYSRQRSLQEQLFSVVSHKELSPRFWEQGFLLPENSKLSDRQPDLAKR